MNKYYHHMIANVRSMMIALHTTNVTHAKLSEPILISQGIVLFLGPLTNAIGHIFNF